MPPHREDRLIADLRRRLAAAGDDLLGDDAALISGAGPWAISVDQQIAGVHFAADLDPRLCGWRLVAVCLSDLAAMGALPRFAFLALSAPDAAVSRRFLRGVTDACRRFETRLAGGDLSRAARLAASLTVIGARPSRGRWLRRGAARRGDSLWVGGTLGESALGRLLIARGARPRGSGVRIPGEARLDAGQAAAARRAVRRHLRPRPQIGLGLELARRRRAAAIDLSDGLALDLHRLCRESGVGALIEAASLPLAPGFKALARRLGCDPLETALEGGEDYVLLFSLPPRARPPAASGCRRIGSIRAAPAIRLAATTGVEELPARGWDHLA